ncbi:TPA: glycosyltransferase family 2 protein [Candidatus Woesearchaeota archaeon]|nr:MAG: Glycosyl transferase family 2 [archaeon GW2011_AR11]HIH92024.1 glycosyltransferase family 2 protein [Candidatus Woesearchaeota archaeon]HII65116.1 glycosyltransferase family 2 protein [Candidatus Woesearchaeota archaeon]
MRIVITIPAYNEGRTLGNVIQDIRKAMDSSAYKSKYRVLVVDDGSADDTAKAARKAGAIVMSHPRNCGLAETFRTEVRKSLELGADIIVHIDADGQYLPKEIPLLIREVQAGNDLVLGSRFRGTIEYMPLIKRWGNKAFSRVISRITGVEISDGQTGFRAFTKEVAKRIVIISSHTYTQEQIIKAVREKFRIKEVPVYFARREGKSRLINNPLEYAAKAWISILRIYRDYEPLRFFGMTGGTIFSLGFLLGLYLVYIQIFGEGVNRHLGLMMLDVLILSIGFQLIIFGFLADMQRK